MEKITFLHTNDLHSHLENWPKIRRYLDQRRKEIEAKGDTVITVDLGDFIDRWHPLTEATDGQANIQLMNQVHYDAATIGNNEGVGNSKAVLNGLYEHADFDVLLANLYDKKTLQAPEWAQPYKIIETKDGTKVGLIALTAPFPLTYSPNGWDIRSPFDILPQLVNQLRDRVDVLVLMSHLGIGYDRAIAEELPQIDVILGSHTHHLFVKGELDNGVLLAAAGKHGQYVGEVDLQLEAGRIVAKQAHTVATETMTVFPDDQSEIDGYLAEGHTLLQQEKVAELPYELGLDPFEEHSLIDATLEAVKVRGQTEAAILNTGLFLEPLPAGIVDQDQLHTTLPHPMHLLRVTLKGTDLVRMVLEMEKNRNFLRNFPVMGMGFRGKIFGLITYSGISYDDVNHQVAWLGKPIEPEKDYNFTTVDHFMFVPFFPTIEIMGNNEFLFPEFIRTVLGDYLTSTYPLD